MINELTNEGCREQALYFAMIDNHWMAMRWYNTAAARTIGHKKTDSYERLAKEQAELGKFLYDPCSYANETDGDAADIKYSWQE